MGRIEVVKAIFVFVDDRGDLRRREEVVVAVPRHDREPRPRELLVQLPRLLQPVAQADLVLSQILDFLSASFTDARVPQ